MKKPDENIIQKIFGSYAMGVGRMPLRSNVYNNGNTSGYSQIGTSAGNRGLFEGLDKKSPLLGTATSSSRLSSYYEKMAELKGS